MTSKNETAFLLRLSKRDRERAELLSQVYDFPISVVHRAALRVLFSLAGLPDDEGDSTNML